MMRALFAFLALPGVGLYRVSRNPMYIAVTLVLVGWTAAYLSGALAFYTMAIMLLFQLRVACPAGCSSAREPWHLSGASRAHLGQIHS